MTPARMGSSVRIDDRNRQCSLSLSLSHLSMHWQRNVPSEEKSNSKKRGLRPDAPGHSVRRLLSGEWRLQETARRREVRVRARARISLAPNNRRSLLSSSLPSFSDRQQPLVKESRTITQANGSRHGQIQQETTRSEEVRSRARTSTQDGGEGASGCHIARKRSRNGSDGSGGDRRTGAERVDEPRQTGRLQLR